MKKSYIVLLVLAIVIAVGLMGWRYTLNLTQSTTNITNFEECAKIYPVMESYPAQCRTPDGKHFTQVIPKETGTPPVQMETIINFEQCAQAGGQIMESYPRQCRSQEGKTFTEYTQ